MRDLFDMFDNPIARDSDPGTSHEAARDVTASGTRAAQAAAVLAAVLAHPGKTSAELALLAGLDRHAAARRTSDLEHAGLVRKGDARPCTASARGLKAVTWWAITREGRQ